jgi:hypothetical protein
MSTTTATRPSIHPSRRALLSVAVAAALAASAGAAAVILTSSDSASSPRAHSAPAVATKVDIPALWTELSTLAVHDENNIVAGLVPSVRAQLRSTAQEIAAGAER